MGQINFVGTICNKDLNIDIKKKVHEINFNADIINKELIVNVVESGIIDSKFTIEFGKVLDKGGGTSDGNAVKYIPQELTEEQKQTARSNIDVYSELQVENRIDVTVGNIKTLLELI